MLLISCQCWTLNGACIIPTFVHFSRFGPFRGRLLKANFCQRYISISVNEQKVFRFLLLCACEPGRISRLDNWYNDWAKGVHQHAMEMTRHHSVPYTYTHIKRSRDNPAHPTSTCMTNTLKFIGKISANEWPKIQLNRDLIHKCAHQCHSSSFLFLSTHTQTHNNTHTDTRECRRRQSVSINAYASSILIHYTWRDAANLWRMYVCAANRRHCDANSKIML